MYQNSVLGNFLWRSGAESFAWCTYNILVQGGGGLPPPVGGSVGGRGRQRPPPKETPCSCTSRACTMYVHLPGAMAMCQFKLHIRDNFFSQTLSPKSDFCLALWQFLLRPNGGMCTFTKLSLTSQWQFLPRPNGEMCTFTKLSLTGQWQFWNRFLKIVIDRSMTFLHNSWVITENCHWLVNDDLKPPSKNVIDWSMTVSHNSWVITENCHWSVNDNFEQPSKKCHLPVNDSFA